MNIIIEKSQTTPRGYQIRYQNGPVNKVYTEEVFYDLHTAMKHAEMMLEAHNSQYNEKCTAKDCIGFDEEALEANERFDLNAKRMLKKIRKGKFDEVRPSPTNAKRVTDAHIKIKRGPAKAGEPQKISINITTQGLFMTMLQVAIEKDENKGITKTKKEMQSVLRGFCKLLAVRGYGKGAAEIEQEVTAMTRDELISWFDVVCNHYNVSEDDMKIIVVECMN